VELRKNSVRQAAEAVCNGEPTAHDLIEITLKNCSVINEGLNIFNHIAGIDAIEQAKAVDRRIENGEQLPLAGLPVVIKDDICYGVLPTGFGSSAFKDFISPHTATAVERVMDAGAIVVGKTNLDDMGMGSTTRSSPNGPTINPWVPGYTAGSAGAAAIAAGIGMFALESDSGGSLRQGASHCGVIGLRPTMGSVSRFGLNAFSSSFGQVGITAFSSENIISVLKIIAGYDPRDSATSVCTDRLDEQNSTPALKDIKIGYPVELIDYLEPSMRVIVEKTRDEYIAQGLKFENVELSLFREALQAYYVIAAAEASSNQARFDGIRFGKTGEADNLEELYHKNRSSTLGREARRRSIFGTFLLSKGNYDLYYRQALKVWSMVRQEFANAFKRCDMILLPAVKKLPASLNGDKGFLDDWSEDLFCAPVSMSGLPSLTLPAGQIEQFPVGIQLVGSPFSEELLTQVGSRVVR